MSVHLVAADTTIRFCTLCNKPIATESAYKRHLSYCRRTQGQPRKRARSCKECHSAKTKCSFEPECSRCKSKGLDCIYEKPVLPISTARRSRTYGDVYGDASNTTNSYVHSMTLFNSSSESNDSCSSLFGSAASLDLPASSPRPIVELRSDPVAAHSAKFVLEAMRGLPRTMVNRESFSWFNHGFWHQPELPQNLAKCTDFAITYVKSQSKDDSFWSIINQENKRLLSDLPHNSLSDLISGMQAQVIYMIMFTLDHSSLEEIPEIRLNMLMTFELYGKKSNELDPFTFFPISDIDNCDVTWEEWIHIESRRRCAITWFLLSRVMDLRFGVMCPSVSNYRALPLPSPGVLWSARTRAEWEAHREVHFQARSTSLRTFGDLIEARSAPSGSELGRELDRWHASCDKLGLLLTLATTMV
ncbi:hypothetical protein F5Y04DRAFT_93670 [Hypomontagnella monticulosa]|nr:hypothetical protein F5Y04DRAFT_93670 [Hypomontagnella monticulosa]